MEDGIEQDSESSDSDEEEDSAEDELDLDVLVDDTTEEEKGPRKAETPFEKALLTAGQQIDNVVDYQAVVNQLKEEVHDIVEEPNLEELDVHQQPDEGCSTKT